MIRDGDVGWYGPGRGGPDDSIDFASGQRRIDLSRIGCERESNPDGGAGVILILDFRFSQRSAIMNAPVDRLETLVHIAAIQEVDEGAGGDRFVLGTHGQIRI